MKNVFVHFLPDDLADRDLAGSTAVVIDVLRASTTIVHALAHGAQAVLPFSTVEDTFAAASGFPAHSRLLGGERKGELIEGFDLDNSPLKYTPEAVGGKTILFTTTNGTRALLRCEPAEQVLIGAFVNQTAVKQALVAGNRDVHLVCAGTNRQLTAEDLLFAGALCAELLELTDGQFQPGHVQAEMARDYYQARHATTESFRTAFFESLGGINLQRLGMIADIGRAMQRNLFLCVPAWNCRSNEIRLL